MNEESPLHKMETMMMCGVMRVMVREAKRMVLFRILFKLFPHSQIARLSHLFPLRTYQGENEE